MESIAERALARYLVEKYGVERVKQVVNKLKKESAKNGQYPEQLRVLQEEMGRN